jgi:voltage-gated potassium channel
VPPPSDPWRRVQRGLLALVAVLVVSTVGYYLLGLGLLDAVYQTVTTVFTVGFREVGEPDDAFKIFTVFVIVLGVGTALYTLGVLVETLVEGRLSDHVGRRRMEKRIDALNEHVIVCGWGRVGRTIVQHLEGTGTDVVVVDRDPERVAVVSGPVVEGDATDDQVLRRAGIERARALVAALSADTDNLYVTLSGRSMRPDLFIVARARVEAAEPKLTQAGADRVVNPQYIGGARIAAMVNQPHVAEFLDVVMHDGSLEFRLAEVQIPEGSKLAGRTLRDTHIRDRTGALVLAMRDRTGAFHTNPGPDTMIASGLVLIAIGTESQLAALSEASRPDTR